MGFGKDIHTAREILEIVRTLKEAIRPVKAGEMVQEEGWYVNKHLILKILDEMI
jgi:hypothetical protein